MGTLTKYVVVTESGNWLDMYDDYRSARRAADGYQGAHVERWTFPETKDETHGEPWKRV